MNAASILNGDTTVSRLIDAPGEKTAWADRIALGIAGLRALAPYAVIELLLPGGSLVALFLWLYRRHKKTTTSEILRDLGVASASSWRPWPSVRFSRCRQPVESSVERPLLSQAPVCG
jgi:hypothetical protein